MFLIILHHKYRLNLFPVAIYFTVYSTSYLFIQLVEDFKLISLILLVI